MMARVCNRVAAAGCVLAAVLLAGCATAADPKPYDYSAFRQAKPTSILVLPPLNQTPDVTAEAGVLSTVTMPLAESGYYVLPVAVTTETFRQNGILTAHDAQQLPPDKLREIFGADAALYLHIGDYGTVYNVVSSNTKVTVRGRLVDLQGGGELWSGEATASTAERKNSGGGNSLLGMLVSALIEQVAETLSERTVEMAELTNIRLLGAGRARGLLYGPHSPKYGSDDKQ